MEKFWIVSLFHVQPTPEQWQEVNLLAHAELGALGIEEFSLDEPQVDAILGDRSYSGGDLPQEVLDEVESVVLGRPTTYRVFFDNAENAIQFKTQVSKILLGEIGLDECQAQDWNAEWKKHYAPIKVNEQIEIIPSWMKPHPVTTKQQIYIYPGMGFGTGSHETTFLCLKLFTEDVLNSKVENVLDFGSGSGILGLSAFKFFPDSRVDFYDIDPEANKNCDQNAELNELLEAKFRLLLPEVRNYLQPKYDVVFANILESILMIEKEYLAQSIEASGSLILSGLLRHQMDGIVKAYEELGLYLVRRVEKGDWGALLHAEKRLMRASWDPDLKIQESYSITGDRFHHLVSVIRIEPAEDLLLLNGAGLKVFTKVESISKKELRLTFVSQEQAEQKTFLDLALGIPKKDAFDLCLKQATELGFRRIFLIRSQYSQNKIPDEERLTNLLVSALEQSNSPFMPQVIQTTWNDIPWLEYDLSLMMDSQSEKRQNNDQIRPAKALLLVGPEGGFSKAEIIDLHARPNIEIIRLPTPILRTPTAVATGAGIILGRLLI